MDNIFGSHCNVFITHCDKERKINRVRQGDIHVVWSKLWDTKSTLVAKGMGTPCPRSMSHFDAICFNRFVVAVLLYSSTMYTSHSHRLNKTSAAVYIPRQHMQHNFIVSTDESVDTMDLTRLRCCRRRARRRARHRSV